MKINIPEELQKIIPRWTRKMLERDSFAELNEQCVIDGKSLEIGEFGCCIVGETHKIFDSHASTNAYDCSDCGHYSMAFYRIIERGEQEPTQAIEELNATLDDFYAHLKTRHTAIIQEVN